MKCFQLGLCFLVMAGVSFGQIVPMSNDDCGTALVVGDGVNPGAPAGVSGNYYTNAGATDSGGVPAACASLNSDVWFLYTATATGVARIGLCTPGGFGAGNLVDNVLQVLDGACPPTTVLACDDDGGCVNAIGSQAMVSVCVQQGVSYHIRVGGWGTAAQTPPSTFYVSIAYQSAPTLGNDDCSGATPLVIGVNGPFGNAGATDSCAQAPCGAAASPGYNDVWYSYTAACCGPHTVDTGCAPLAMDTIATVHAICGGPPIACNDDCTGFLASSVTWTASAGVTYYLRIASWSAITVGSFSLTVTPPNPGVSGMSLIYSYPLGPGSLQIDICNGPLFGIYFLAVTFNQAGFPNGWFYGLDMFPAEIANLINTGAPFLGPLDPTCGAFTIGPIPGLGAISGVPIYSVALGAAPGILVPVTSSPPTLAVIP
jgi:hypothetical protein